MLICVVLTNIYVFKFFLWETGYFCTMDIAHDRAGFYICWGCLVWVPSVYTSPALHLVQVSRRANASLLSLSSDAAR